MSWYCLVHFAINVGGLTLSVPGTFYKGAPSIAADPGGFHVFGIAHCFDTWIHMCAYNPNGHAELGVYVIVSKEFDDLNDFGDRILCSQTWVLI